MTLKIKQSLACYLLSSATQKAKSKEPTMQICFDFIVYWYINLCRLFNTKAILLEEQ